MGSLGDFLLQSARLISYFIRKKKNHKKHLCSALAFLNHARGRFFGLNRATEQGKGYCKVNTTVGIYRNSIVR